MNEEDFRQRRIDISYRISFYIALFIAIIFIFTINQTLNIDLLAYISNYYELFIQEKLSNFISKYISPDTLKWLIIFTLPFIFASTVDILENFYKRIEQYPSLNVFKMVTPLIFAILMTVSLIFAYKDINEITKIEPTYFKFTIAFLSVYYVIQLIGITIAIISISNLFSAIIILVSLLLILVSLIFILLPLLITKFLLILMDSVDNPNGGKIRIAIGVNLW